MSLKNYAVSAVFCKDIDVLEGKNYALRMTEEIAHSKEEAIGMFLERLNNPVLGLEKHMIFIMPVALEINLKAVK